MIERYMVATDDDGHWQILRNGQPFITIRATSGDHAAADLVVLALNFFVASLHDQVAVPADLIASILVDTHTTRH